MKSCFCCWCCCLCAWVMNRCQQWKHGRSPMKNLTLHSPTRFCYMYIHATRIHDLHCFLCLRTLPATSQRSWWLGLNAMTGAVSSTSAASRRALCWWRCSVSFVVFFFSLGQDGKLFLWLVFDEAGSRLVFFLFAPRSFCFFLLFSSKKTGADGDPPGLAQGHKVGRHAVPRDPWPSWVAGHLGASRGSFLFFLFGLQVVSLRWLLLLIKGACCRNLRLPLPHKVAEVEPGVCQFFFVFCVYMRVCECALRSQDLRKTAYVVEGDGLLPLLGRLQRELGVWPRGEWHISLWAAKTAEVF